MNPLKCKDCRYSKPQTAVLEGHEDPCVIAYECRRHSPGAIGWPTVHPESWCADAMYIRPEE